MPSARPNILCFATDQHRADHLGCAGNPDLRTPNIDRLAAEGVRFAQSFVANPVCMPNRASLFTGRYPGAHRLRENGAWLPPVEVTLPETLRQDGYATASVGKLHLTAFQTPADLDVPDLARAESEAWWAAGGRLPMPYYGLEHVYFVGGHGHYTFGDYTRDLERAHPGAWDLMLPASAREPMSGAFECWKSPIPEAWHYNTVIADRTIDDLRTRPADRPFFLWCSFPDPHHPFSPPQPWSEAYDPAAITCAPVRRPGELDAMPGLTRTNHCADMANDAHLREMLALTYGMIGFVDAQIGRVLDEVRRLGLWEDTIIVFISDHGDMMGDHGCRLKGPFPYRGVMQVPTIIRVPGRQARVADGLFSAVDLMPTLLDYAGIGIPAGVQGVSQRAVVDGEADRARDWTYTEYDDSSRGPMRLRHLRSRDWALTYFPLTDEGALFDLRHDPDELHNRWDDPAYAGARRDLMGELARQALLADDWLPEKRCHA